MKPHAALLLAIFACAGCAGPLKPSPKRVTTEDLLRDREILAGVRKEVDAGRVDEALAMSDREMAKVKSDEVRSLLWLETGNIHMEFKRKDKAREHYEESLRLDDDQYLASYALGVCWASKNPKKAIQYFEKSLQDTPHDRHAAKVLASIGLIDELKGDFAAAEEKYKKALELDPKNQMAKLGLEAVRGKSPK